MSVTRQTLGMARLADPFIEGFGLTPTESPLACLFGIISSSVFLATVGRWFGQLGNLLTIDGFGKGRWIDNAVL